jgi:hypothetical protein
LQGNVYTKFGEITKAVQAYSEAIDVSNGELVPFPTGVDNTPKAANKHPVKPALDSISSLRLFTTCKLNKLLADSITYLYYHPEDIAFYQKFTHLLFSTPRNNIYSAIKLFQRRAQVNLLRQIFTRDDCSYHLKEISVNPLRLRFWSDIQHKHIILLRKMHNRILRLNAIDCVEDDKLTYARLLAQSEFYEHQGKAFKAARDAAKAEKLKPRVQLGNKLMTQLNEIRYDDARLLQEIAIDTYSLIDYPDNSFYYLSRAECYCHLLCFRRHDRDNHNLNFVHMLFNLIRCYNLINSSTNYVTGDDFPLPHKLMLRNTKAFLDIRKVINNVKLPSLLLHLPIHQEFEVLEHLLNHDNSLFPDTQSKAMLNTMKARHAVLSVMLPTKGIASLADKLQNMAAWLSTHPMPDGGTIEIISSQLRNFKKREIVSALSLLDESTQIELYQTICDDTLEHPFHARLKRSPLSSKGQGAGKYILEIAHRLESLKRERRISIFNENIDDYYAEETLAREVNMFPL